MWWFKKLTSSAELLKLKEKSGKIKMEIICKSVIYLRKIFWEMSKWHEIINGMAIEQNKTKIKYEKAK